MWPTTLCASPSSAARRTMSPALSLTWGAGPRAGRSPSAESCSACSDGPSAWRLTLTVAGATMRVTHAQELCAHMFTHMRFHSVIAEQSEYGDVRERAFQGDWNSTVRSHLLYTWSRTWAKSSARHTPWYSVAGAVEAVSQGSAAVWKEWSELRYLGPMKDCRRGHVLGSGQLTAGCAAPQLALYSNRRGWNMLSPKMPAGEETARTDKGASLGPAVCQHLHYAP